MILKRYILFAHLLASTASSLNKTPCQFFQTRHENEENYVVCQGEFKEIDSLKESLQNITEIINVFELHNASIDALPEDLFGSLQNAVIRKVIFSRSSIGLLFIPEMKYSPFKSVEDTLENLEIYDSSSVFAWNVSILASLKKLKSLIIENSEHYEVKETLGSLPSLRFLQFLNCHIKWIQPKVFQNIKNLTICSLSNNYIEELKRSMFPKPAVYLWSLDLSFNKLKTLPKDMFTEMPSLHELKLDNNHLKRFDFNRVSPVWNRLTQLWLDDNGAVCWTLCWIVAKQHRLRRPLFLDSTKCYLGKSILLDSFYPFCKK